MDEPDRTLGRPSDHDTGADTAKRLPRQRREGGGAGPRGRYAAALLWPLACLALYAWQLIRIAGG